MADGVIMRGIKDFFSGEGGIRRGNDLDTGVSRGSESIMTLDGHGGVEPTEVDTATVGVSSSQISSMGADALGQGRARVAVGDGRYIEVNESDVERSWDGTATVTLRDSGRGTGLDDRMTSSVDVVDATGRKVGTESLESAIRGMREGSADAMDAFAKSKATGSIDASGNGVSQSSDGFDMDFGN